MKEQPSGGPVPRRRLRPGLSARLWLLTILFVLLAEILIYVPSIANFRNSWLSDRLAQARTAALLLESAAPDALSKPVIDELLASMQTSMIVLKMGTSRRLLALHDTPPMIDFEIDLREMRPAAAILNAFDILIAGENRTIRVVGPAPMGGDFVEIVIRENPLRQAMLGFSRNILLLSLLISAITAMLVYAALNALIVGPVKRLALATLRFRENPDDPDAALRTTIRSDEIGLLEHELSQMQASIRQQLRQREHLANLGLAVAKINHDLRNMLASALLMADRLGSLPDPNVQRFVPKLLDALDRAIAFCQSSLAYGKAEERPASIRRFDLAPLVEEVGDQLDLSSHSVPRFSSRVAAPFYVAGDPDHLNRVLTNLVRNAVAALEQHAVDTIAEIVIHARRIGARIEIDVCDNGPGLPPLARQRLFQAFSSVASRGGTGLGLAIAQDLMRGMGGSIELVVRSDEDEVRGATFRLVLYELAPTP